MTYTDHFSACSAAYATFRPRYPDALFEFLAHVAPGRDAAWDAGTGNGQAATGLARHFTNVVATDASVSQIDNAIPDARVTYRVAKAEASGLEDNSVDLATAAQALHWFDRPRYWAEVRRVLRPRGVVAVWTYDLFEITPRIDTIVQRFYSGIVGPYWPPERRIVEGRYRTIEFPFTEFAAPECAIEQEVTLNDVAGYIRTWSATRAFIKQRHQDPVDELITELAKVWSVGTGPRGARLARWPIAMRVGRV